MLEEDELVDDEDKDLRDELLGLLLLFILSFLLSLDMTLACFLGEESSFGSLASCAVQIQTVEGAACFSGNLPPSVKIFPCYPLATYTDLRR